MPLRNRILGRLAAASLAIGTCASLPVDALAAWVEDELENEPGVTPLEAVSTAGRLTAGARATVSAFWPKSRDASEGFVSELLEHDFSALRIAAAGALGQILELASPMERVEIVCRWTVADDASARLTVARALSLATQVLVRDLALGELARDADAEVRAAAARAARAHFDSDPKGYGAILAHLGRDPVEAVRAATVESRTESPIA
jgi:hypothetical protein